MRKVRSHNANVETLAELIADTDAAHPCTALERTALAA
jgi:hypothetical protein